MDTAQTIKRQQREWAARVGLTPDAKGYLPTVRDNLLQPMTADTKAAFERGGGQELIDGPRQPAKMRALHSSAALVVNVFDYWVERGREPLRQAMGMGSPIDRVALERPYPTGLRGTAPHLDLTLTTRAGVVCAWESKFTEWLVYKAAGGEPFKGAYFANHAKHWASVGLPQCQSLAEALRDEHMIGRNMFCYLDAPQLLKHALGLAGNLRDFALGYIYYDAPGHEAATHRRELEAFESRVGAELGFRAMTYQDLFTGLKENAHAHAEYLRYLERRYFSGDSASGVLQ